MSTLRRALLRIKNPELKKLIETTPPQHQYNWRTLPSFMQDYEFNTSVGASLNLQQYFTPLYEQILSKNDSIRDKRKNTFSLLPYPNWIKKRADEFFPKIPLSEPVADEAEEAKQFSETTLKRWENILFPSDWISAFLNLRKPTDVDYPFWSKILSDVAYKDADYEAALKAEYEAAATDFTPEAVEGLKNALPAIRELAKNKYTAKITQFKKEQAERSRRIEEINQTHLAYYETLPPFARQEKKKKLTEWTANVKYALEHDPYQFALLADFQPSELDVKINSKLFAEFGVDESTRAVYRDFSAKYKQIRAQKDDIIEKSWVEVFNKFDKVSVKAQDGVKEAEKELMQQEEWFALLKEHTIWEEFDRHPEAHYRAEFNIKRHRWDPNMSDEDWKQALKNDVTWWNLPRNP